MTSAEAAALRDIFLREEIAVPAIDARRLAEVYVAIRARAERDRRICTPQVCQTFTSTRAVGARARDNVSHEPSSRGSSWTIASLKRLVHQARTFEPSTILRFR